MIIIHIGTHIWTLPSLFGLTGALILVLYLIFVGNVYAQPAVYFRVIGGIPHLPVLAKADIVSPALGMLIYSTDDSKPLIYTVGSGWKDLCTSDITGSTSEDYFKISGGIPYLPSKTAPTGTSPISGSLCYSTNNRAIMVYATSTWVKVSEMNTGTFSAGNSYFESFGSDIKTCKIPVLTSAPAPIGLTTGAMYINSTAKAIVFYNGSSWQNVSCAVLATVTTAAASAITATTATSGGNVTADGGASVTVRGVCWSTSSGPTIALSTKTSDGTGTGVFTSSITGLTGVTTYYVRAYATNSVGTAYGNEVSFTSTWACGSSITINHVAGTVAPVTKTVTYGTLTSSLSGASKCWITRNLGASQQASSATDNTEASAGWYWQFNRKQGYQYTTTRTPSSAWDATNDNSSATWEASKDPCTLELGSGWRIPTSTEPVRNGQMQMQMDYGIIELIRTILC